MTEDFYRERIIRKGLNCLVLVRPHGRDERKADIGEFGSLSFNEK